MTAHLAIRGLMHEGALKAIEDADMSPSFTLFALPTVNCQAVLTESSPVAAKWSRRRRKRTVGLR